MSEENKAVIRRLVEAVNNQDIKAIENVYTPDLVYYGTGELAKADRNTFVQFLSAMIAGFPDLRLTIDDLLADEDKVVYRLTIQGTHTAEMMGIPATNKAVTVRSIGIAASPVTR